MTDTDPVSEGLGFIKRLFESIKRGKGAAVAFFLGLFDPETSQFANKVADVIVPHLKLTGQKRAQLYGRLFGANKGLLEIAIKRIPNEAVSALLEKSIDFGDFLFAHIVNKSVDRDALVKRQREKVLEAMDGLTAEQRAEAAEALDNFYGELSDALTQARKDAGRGKEASKIDRKQLRKDLGELSQDLSKWLVALMDKLSGYMERGLRGWAWAIGRDPDRMMKTFDVLDEAREVEIAEREDKLQAEADKKLAMAKAQRERAQGRRRARRRK